MVFLWCLMGISIDLMDDEWCLMTGWWWLEHDWIIFPYDLGMILEIIYNHPVIYNPII